MAEKIWDAHTVLPGDGTQPDLLYVDLHLVHGSPLAVNDFWWESLPDHAHRMRIEASGADVICCTHSGLPWVKRVEGTLVVNVGVLGRPANDGGHHVWYALLDIVDGTATAELVTFADQVNKELGKLPPVKR